MESGKKLKSREPVQGELGQRSSSAVIVVILLGLASGFVLGGFIVVGLADHYGASNAVMISLLTASTVGVPTTMVIWFVRKWDRRAGPIVQLMVAFTTAMLAYLAFAPRRALSQSVHLNAQRSSDLSRRTMTPSQALWPRLSQEHSRG